MAGKGLGVVMGCLCCATAFTGCDIGAAPDRSAVRMSVEGEYVGGQRRLRLADGRYLAQGPANTVFRTLLLESCMGAYRLDSTPTGWDLQFEADSASRSAGYCGLRQSVWRPDSGFVAGNKRGMIEPLEKTWLASKDSAPAIHR